MSLKIHLKFKIPNLKLKRQRSGLLLGLMALVILIPLVVYLARQPRSAMADSLLGFNEGGGPTVGDTNGNVSGTITNAVWKSESDCHTGKCLYFDGTGDFVSFGDDPDLDFVGGDTFSLSFWFRHAPISSGTQVIVAKYLASSGTDGGYKVQMESDGDITFGVDDDQTSFPEDSVTTTAATYDDNLWHRVVAVKNGTTTLSLYIDGLKVGEKGSLSATNTLVNTDAFYVGIDGDGSSNAYQGFLDELKVSRTAFTQQQVNTDLVGAGATHNTTLSQGLVGYWKMDETALNSCGTNSDACDVSGNNLHLSAYDNATTVSSPGKYGNAATLDGTGDYYCTDLDDNGTCNGSDDSNTLDMGTNNWTLSAWIYVNTIEQQTFFFKGASTVGAGNDGYFILMDADNDLLTYFSDGSASRITAEANDVISSGNWFHLVVTFNRQSQMQQFINGALVGQADISTQAGNVDTSRRFALGAVDTGTIDLNGKMDEIRAYNRALTPSEIQELYHSAPEQARGTTAEFGTNQAGAVLSNGLIAWWKMDEAGVDAEGETVPDSSGNGNIATLYGDNSTGDNGSGMDCTAAGKFGTGCNFDGTDDSLRISNLSIGATSTISFWMKMDSSIVDCTSIPGLMASGTSHQNGFVINNGGSNCHGFKFKGNNSADAQSAVGLNIIPDPYSWNHITGVSNSTGLYLYINGQLAAHNDTTFTNTSLNNSTYYLGSAADYATRFFKGTLDEVRVYSRALSEAEVHALYNWAPGPVAYYKLNEGTGTTSVNDSSGNNLIASMNGPMDQTNWVNGKYGSALGFNGSNQYLDAGEQALFNMGSHNLTLAVWFKRSLGTTANIVGEGSSGTNGLRYGLSFNTGDCGSTGRIKAEIDDNTTKKYVCSTNSFNDNQWHYAALVRDDNNLRLFIDGTEAGTASDITGYGSLNSTRSFTIGALYDESQGSIYQYFNGSIDDIKVYSYARTPEQIIEDMNAGHPAPGSPVGSPLLWWKFNEGADNTCSGGTNDACNAGSGGVIFDGSNTGSVWTNNGKFGKAISINNTNDDISAGDVSFTDAAPAMTWSLWLNPQSITTLDTIIAKSQPGVNATHAFNITTSNPNADELAVFVGDGVDVADYFETSNFDLTTGNWIHLVVVYDGTQANHNRVKVYKNSLPMTGTVYGTIPTAMIASTPHNLKLGNRDSANSALLAYYDDVKIYNFAFNDDQVKAEYNQGKATVFGASSTTSSGTPSNASVDSYCPPGQGSSCTSPKAEWKFDENSGTATINDSSGNGNTGTMTSFTGNPWTVGRYGSALTFDGATGLDRNDLVNAGSDTSIDNIFDAGGTISGWIKLGSSGENNGWIVAKGGAAGGACVGGGGYSVYITQSGNNLRFNFAVQEGGTDGLWYTDYGTWGTLPMIRWHHFAVDYNDDNTSNNPVFYLDGRQFTVSNGIVESTSPVGGYCTDASDVFLIGNTLGQSSTTDGSLDSIRLYDYSRTPAQIAWEFNQGGPVGWWKFNDSVSGNAQTLNDSSGNNYNGTTVDGGGTTLDCTVTGKRNQACQLDGTNDSVSIGDQAIYDYPNDSDAFSLSAWVNRSTLNSFDVVVAKKNAISTQNEDGYALYFDTTNGILFDLGDGSGNSCRAFYQSNVLANTWYHLSAVYDENDSCSIYLDGKLVGRSTFAATNGPDNGLAFNIGAESDAGNPFIGKLDDIKIFNYALTPQQIQMEYAGGAVYFSQ